MTSWVEGYIVRQDMSRTLNNESCESSFATVGISWSAESGSSKPYSEVVQCPAYSKVTLTLSQGSTSSL